jgi:hypothetical protein
VAAALGAQLDVMQIQERRVSADLAAMLVAEQYRPAQGWRDALFGASTWLRASSARG